MRVLFVTTQTSDTHNLINAWDSCSETPALRFQFNYLQFRADPQILDAARKAKAEVIFYVGGCAGVGLPRPETFRELRKMAPLVNLIPDAADPPWHPTIAMYRHENCFDLHVGLDGEKKSPVDIATVTPTDWRPFSVGKVEKDIRCGFTGTLGGKRTTVLSHVGSRCFIRLRGEDYADHVNFLRRCRIVLNTAFTGSGHFYHVKGRVIEAGWAGAALLEHRAAPTQDWLPEHSTFPYEDAKEARDVIDSATDEQIAIRAERLSRAVREKYHPAMIYGEILERLGLTHSLSCEVV